MTHFKCHRLKIFCHKLILTIKLNVKISKAETKMQIYYENHLNYSFQVVIASSS